MKRKNLTSTTKNPPTSNPGKQHLSGAGSKLVNAKPHIRLIVIYGTAMAIGVLVLQWLESQFLLNIFSTELYVVILCTLFTGLGVWIGYKLIRRTPSEPSEINTKARRPLRHAHLST